MRFEQNMSQQQKQVQKLAMTQQLQQSIQMLQYNSEELTSFLENKALENPLIEIDVSAPYTESDYSAFSGNTTNRTDNQENNYMNQIADNKTSLFEYVLDQIHLNYRDTYLRQLLLFLTEYIDVNGYLTISLAEGVEKTGATYIEMLDALTLLQQLDPAGIGARNLQECLMLQTERDYQAPNLAYIVLEEVFDCLVKRKWKEISLKYEISLSAVQEIFDYIQTLSPFPGAVYGENEQQFVRPDLIITIDETKIQILSTKIGTPAIQFQQNYYNKMTQVDDQEVLEYIKEKKLEFDWLKKSLIQRGDTILRVGTEIVERQKDFFLSPTHPLKPMTLKEVSEALEIHESTVSRAVNGKYLQTFFGIFELRSFFTTGFARTAQSENQEELSADTVKKKLLELVDTENKAKPLSDQKLVELLSQEEIKISRRTVAKYRDALGILSSAKRKRYDE